MGINFGKYDVPPTLQKLIDLQNELGDPEQFYQGLNFYLSLEDFRYFNTPCDVVVFANIGLDGVHYGFLTDFGSVSNLEIAPIVCVCPMDFDRPTRVVAKNIREFLRINLTDAELFYNQFKNEESYLAAKEQWLTEAANSPYQPSDHEKRVREKITKFLYEKIHMPVIENPYRYVQNIELERKNSVSIQTRDGLGVTTPLLQGEEHTPFPMQTDIDPELELVQEYLYTKPIASRLALIRDIQLTYVLDDNEELLNIITDALYHLDLIDEANRLSEVT